MNTKTKTKTLLMIRAQDQATDFVADLGVPNPVVFAPMVHIEALNVDQALPEHGTIIFTSANAVQHFARKIADRHAPVYCVGSITKRAAIKAGFSVTRAFETAGELVDFFRDLPKTTRRILYPRAETVSVDIASALSEFGFQIRDAILYRQSFLQLSDQARNLIESSPLVVPIFSQEIAKRFQKELVLRKPHDLTVICISAPVAAIFNNISGIHVKIAQKPDRAAIIAEIKLCIST
jgi:uroporphyrinogen-III synthase